jgi:hypothetical protein
VTFTVTATGTGLSYQWRKNGTNIGGAISSSYSILSTGASDAANYDVVVSGTCAPAATSSVAALTVNPPPAITVQPVASQSQCVGTPATFTVTATGTGLSYQWRKNGTNIGGAISNSYTIASLAVSDAATYDVVVSGTCTPAVTSSGSVLTVNSPPAITVQPVTQSVCQGSGVTFTVTATGTGLSYQWRKNGTNIGGAISSSYSILSTGASDAANYDVVVSGTCAPAATSSVAALTVNPPPAITVQPVASQSQCVGTPATFTVTATGTGLSYQWRKNGTNIGGAISNSYTIASLAVSDAATYDVVVSGTCTPAVTSSGSVLTVNSPPAITVQPVTQSVCQGSGVTFTVTATGTGLSYQWRKNGTNIGGAISSSYSILSTGASDAANYDVVVSGTCAPAATSSVAALTVNPPPAITVQPVASQSQCVGTPATFTVTATGTGLSYQWRKNGTNIGGAISNSYTIASLAVSDAATYDVVVSGTCTPAVTSSGSVLTVNSPPAITVQPVTQSVCQGSGVTFTVTATGTGLSYQWRKNGTNIGGAISSSYSILSTGASDAANYDVVVSGTCAPAATSSVAALTVNPPPAITVQPVASQSQCVGTPATFTVTATGTGLSYQWRKNGTNIGGAISNSYTIASLAVSDAATYDVVVSGTCTPAVTSSGSVLTVNSPPAITVQPVTQSVCQGSGVTFTVTATGTGLSYQWRKNGTNIGGAISSSYSILSTGASDAANYDVVVSGTCAPAATSSVAALTVNPPPAITVQPVASQSQCVGTPATFTVTATGTGLSYQWRKNGTNIGGAISNSYTIASLAVSDAATYDVVVSGTCTPAVTSSGSVLTVNSPPAITVQPVTQSVCQGSGVTFTVTATGTGLSYQWRKNGTNIGGAISSSYSILSTGASDAANYDVVVSGTCAPAATSSVAALTVNPPPAITVQPVASQSQCVGTPATFTVTATGTGLSYQWRKNGTNIGGAISNSYTIASLAVSDAATYDVVVSGTCTPAVTSSGSVLTVNSPPAITVQPVTQSVCQGSGVTFTVTATGTGLSYQWRKNGTNIGGAISSSYSILSTGASDAANYDVVVSGTCAPAATSSVAALTVNPPPAITVQPVASQSQCVGTPATFTVTATGTGLSYQWRKNGTNIGGAISNSYTIASLAVSDAATYDVVVSGTCTPAVTSSGSVLTVNSPPAITVQPVTQSVCQGSGVTFTVTATGTGLSYQWRKNGTNIGGAISSSYSILSTGASDAANYDVVVSGTCAPAATSSVAALTVNPPPAITVQPVASQSQCVGTPATFTVTATGTGLSYQWRKNGTNIGGAISNSYTIASLAVSDAATYDVVVSGTCTPAVTSSGSVLTVNSPPAITVQPVTQSVCQGSGVTFTVTATGTGLSYQWRKNGTNIGGAISSSYSILSTGASDAANYDVVVSGTCAPAATSSVAALTVNPPPAITVQPVASQSQCVGTPATFTVTATGTGLSYQWRKNGTNIGGAISNSYTIASLAVSDAATYDVVVSGTCTPAVTSSGSVLTVNSPPAITVQPVTQSVCQGSGVTFTVTATGTGLSYQWRKNGTNIGGAISSSYSILSTGASDAANYDVVVSGTCAPAATSSVAALTVNPPPAITVQPVASQSQCVGTPATFTVTATGTGLSYQWRKNGTNIGGAISNSYTIASLAVSDAATYDVVVSGTCTPAVTSSGSVLTVNSPPAITVQPVTQSVCQGSGVTFTVTATGTGLSYQWRKNGTNIGGAISSSYSILSTGASDAANYDVVVSGTCAPAATSSVAALTVNPPPAITVQPVASQSQCVGTPATFTVTATGTGLSYQWRKNGTNIGGAISNSYTIASLAVSDAATYDVVVSGTCTPAVTSSGSVLTVNSPPAITVQPPASTTSCAGTNVLLSVTATGTGLTYQWIDVATSLPPVGAYFSGINTNSLLISGIDATLNGKQYQVVVSGTCAPSASSIVSTLTVQNLPQITGQPSNSTICENTNTNFSVNAGVTTSPTYQWQVSTDGGLTFNNVSGAVYSGATSATLTLTTTPFSYSGYLYRVVVGGACAPAVISSSALLSVQQNAIVTTGPSNVTACQNATVSFSVLASGYNLSYQWQENGVNLSNTGIYSGVNTNTLTLAGITLALNANKYQVVVKNASGFCTAAVTSSFATLTVNKIPDAAASDVTICSGSSTNISITNPNGTPGTTFTWIVQSSTNVTGASGGVGSLINQSLTSTDGINVGSVTYSITPQAAGCNGIPFAVNATVNPIPQVSAQADAAFCPGTSINIPLPANIAGSTVSWTNSNPAIGIPASGLGDLVFTGGTNISGADVVGTITYQATKNGCTGPSKNFNLTIHPSPVVTPVGNITVCSGGAVVAINFSANTGGGETYNWTNSNPSTGLAPSGSGNIAAFTAAVNTTGSAVTGTVSVTATKNGCTGPVKTFTITVNPEPVVAAVANQAFCPGTGINIPLTSNVAGSVQTWTNSNPSIGIAASGTGDIIYTAPANNTGADVTGTITVTGTANGCSSAGANQKTFTITLHPNPVITNTALQLQTTICSGTTLSFLPTSNTGVTTTYAWTTTTTGVLTGVSASGSGTITDTPVNSGNTAGTITYTITPTFNSCVGLPVNYVVTINPVPTVSASNQTICSGQTTSVAITNPNTVSGTTFAWAVSSSTNVTGMSGGSGVTISQLLTSTDGINPGTVNYTITPTANGCAGTPIVVTVTVNPAPVITNTSLQLQTTICSGTALGFTPTSSIGGTTYTWTSSVTGSVTGNTASGSGMITDALTNSSNTVGTVTYHITPSVSGCSGTSRDYVVTVQPAPSFTFTNSSAQICSGSQTNILLNTPVAGGQVRLKSVSYGAVSGTLSAGALYNDGQFITEVLINSTNAPVTVTYQFEAIVGACGPSASMATTVVVNPNPTMGINNTTAVICSGTQPSITLTSPTSGASISLQNVSYGAITGGLYASGGTFTTGAVISESVGGLVNNTNNPITITYTFTVSTPLTTPSCPLSATTQSTTVQVLPEPTIPIVTNNAPTICSGSQANITLNTAVGGGQIVLSAVNYGAVSGTLSSGLLYSSGQKVTEVLVNPTNAPVTVVYQFAVVVGGCVAGPLQTVNVVVNPSPVFSITNNTLEVCEGSPVNIQLNSPTTGAVITLSSVNYNGVTGTMSPGTTFTNGQFITETLATPFTTPTTVTYTFTVAASGCSNPTSQQTTVSITKQATVSLPADYTVCQPASIALTGTIGGSAVTGLWSVVSGGGTLSASNLSGSTVTATYTPVAADVTHTVTLKLTTNDPDGAGPCSPAIATINIHINQSAQVFAPANLAICQDVPGIALGGSIGGSTVATVWSGGLGTFSNVNDPNATYTFKNPNEINTTVVLTFTALDPDGAGPCTAVSTQTNLKINPLPIVTFSGFPPGAPPQVVANTLPFPLTGNQIGGLFTISPSTPGVGITTQSPVDKATFYPSLATLGLNTVTYNFTDINSCTNSTSQNIIVNPVTTCEFTIFNKVTFGSGEIPICSSEGNVQLVGTPLPNGQPATGFFAVGPYSTGSAGYGGVQTYADSVLIANSLIISGSNVYLNTTNLPAKEYFIYYQFQNTFGAITTKLHPILVFPYPKPKFSSSNNCVVNAVTFYDSSKVQANTLPVPYNSSTIVNYIWDFNDGSPKAYFTSPFTSTSHKYGVPSNYNVTLQVVTDAPNGGCTAMFSYPLTVGNPPSPAFSWSAICTNDSTKFVDHSFPGVVSTITNLKWDFGDGKTISGSPGAKVTNSASNLTSGTYSKPNHKYNSNSIYPVTLTVTNNNGCFATTPVKKVFILAYKTLKISADSAYEENFENIATHGGGWIPEVPDGYFATNATLLDSIKSDTSWVWSKPNGLVIQPSPQTGNYSWWTGKNNNSYFYYENSAINGPCFNLSKLNRPKVSFDYWVNTEVNADGAVLQYSVNGGTSWELVGPLAGLPTSQRNQGINWYPPGAIVTANPGEQPSFGPYGWTGNTQASWYRASYNLDMIPWVNPLPPYDSLRKQVRLRIAFASKGIPSGGTKYDGFAFDNVYVGNKTKNVLFENFTNANQTSSLIAESNFNTLYQAQLSARNEDTDFTYLQYHVRFPAPDVFSQTNADDASARALFYNVQQPPYSVMSGIQTGIFANGDYSTFLNGVEIDRMALKKPQLIITKVDTLPTGSSNKINARIHVKADTTVTYPIYANIALMEERDSLTVPGKTYTHIMRKLLFSGSGNTPPLGTLNPGDSLILSNPANGGVTTLNCTIKDATKLRLVAWVQNIDPLKRGAQEIVQSFVSPIKLNTKTGQVITGVEQTTGSLDDLVLYPNPAESKFNLALPGDFPEGCIWKIADQRGIYVMSGNFSDAFNGKKTISISLQSGVYIVAVGAPGQTPVYRRLVVLNPE